jgi:hypothetical protein
MRESPELFAKISDRVSRAEELVALQRARVRERSARGWDVYNALALLHAMEALAEQFRASHRILCSRASRGTPDPWKVRGPATEVCRTAPQPHLHIVRPIERKLLLCPHCALTIGLEGDGDPAFVYEVADWERRCRHRELHSPVLCHLLRAGQSTSLH